MTMLQSRMQAAVLDVTPRVDVEDVIRSVRRRRAVKRSVAAVLVVAATSAGIAAAVAHDIGSTVVAAPPQEWHYHRVVSGYVVDLRVTLDSPMVRAVNARFDVGDREAIAAGRPTVPTRCRADRALDLHVTRDGIEQFLSEAAGWARPPDATGLAITESLGRRTPDDRAYLSVTVVRVSRPDAVEAFLRRGDTVVDTAPVTDGWAVLVEASTATLPVNDPAARVAVTGAGGRVLASRLFDPPEVPGAYC